MSISASIDPHTTRDSVMLPPPDRLRRLLPVPDCARNTIDSARTAIRSMLRGVDSRLLVIVGPCSIHDESSALTYAGRLSELSEEYASDLVLVMRTFFEKPRTALGWPGFATAPDVFGPADPISGFTRARALAISVNEIGVPTATEWLTVHGAAYLRDVMAWGAIGARTVESQVHRHLASSLDLPIGMKNRPDGAMDVAVNAIHVGMRDHAFLGIADNGCAAMIRTVGNPDCHLVLRGGAAGPNHHEAAVEDACRQLAAAGLPPRIVIDASHGNSGKVPERQYTVAHEIGASVTAGAEHIVGVMLESFLEPGAQTLEHGRTICPDISVTDPCLGWEQTVDVIDMLARAARARRSVSLRLTVGGRR